MTILRKNVEFAKRIFSDRLGDPYVYGGNWDPFNVRTGTDCSGLVGDILDACLLGTTMPWQRSVSTESWPYDYGTNTPAAPGTVGPKGTIAIAHPGDAPPDAAVIVSIMHRGGGENSHTNCQVDGQVMESNGGSGTCTIGTGAVPITHPEWTDWWYLPGPISDTPAASPPPSAPGIHRDVTWADVEAKLDGIFHTTHIIYTVQGTGQPDPMGPGYPADIARQLNPNVWTWQPVGNYEATAFPMNASIKQGEDELVRLITQAHPDRTFGMIGYSQGAIVTSNVYDRLRTGDLQKYRSQFIGGITQGNPRREQGHTIPGGIDPKGHGIVTPNLVGTEELWWDFAAGKNMVGSPGQDLYTTTGYNGDAQSVLDMEAIWKIVDEGQVTSIGDLLDQLLKIVGNPVGGSVSALMAAIDALDFFVVKGITPHTSYQFVQPIAGDSRDAWRVGLDYLNALGAAVPARIGVGSVPAPQALPVVRSVQSVIEVAPPPVVTTPERVPVPQEKPVLDSLPPLVQHAPVPAGDSVNKVTEGIKLFKQLPVYIHAAIQFLTVAGTVVGSVAAVLPNTADGTTAGVAVSAGIVAAIVRLLTHQPQPKV